MIGPRIAGRSAGVLVEPATTRPVLPAEAVFGATPSTVGFWIVGQVLYLATGLRVLLDALEDLLPAEVRPDRAYTAGLLAAADRRVRAAGIGPDRWPRPPDPDDGEMLSPQAMRAVLWATYSRSIPEGPAAVRLPRTVGLPRMGVVFAEGATPPARAQTFQPFNPETLASNPWTGRPGTQRGEGFHLEGRAPRRGSSDAKWFAALAGVLILTRD